MKLIDKFGTRRGSGKHRTLDFNCKWGTITIWQALLNLNGTKTNVKNG